MEGNLCGMKMNMLHEFFFFRVSSNRVIKGKYGEKFFESLRSFDKDFIFPSL